MNTHSYLPAFPIIVLLLISTHLFSQHANPQVKVVSDHVVENFSKNKAYSIENVGLNASDFAKTRSTAARLRLKEKLRDADKVRQEAFELIKKSESKIRAAKHRLAVAKQNGTLSPQSIRQQSKHINNAEQKLQQLKDSMKSLTNLKAGKNS
ncbi:MAG: hypothetical protein AAFZ15_07950 [Bacteroidota bacterium]